MTTDLDTLRATYDHHRQLSVNATATHARIAGIITKLGDRANLHPSLHQMLACAARDAEVHGAMADGAWDGYQAALRMARAVA